jgi:hypothetical protein
MKKVFISSVMREYSEIRNAAKEAVETVNHYPVMAENFGARPTSPQGACLEGVRESEIYLGIFGQRYSRPTEEEFHEAVSSGKDLLIFAEKVDMEPKQEVFLEDVEDWTSGFNRASFSTKAELSRGIVKSLSRLLTAVTPDFGAGAQRLAKVNEFILKKVDDRSTSWLWLSTTPAVSGPNIPAAKFQSTELRETLEEAAFVKECLLFSRAFGTQSRLEGKWLEARQRDPKKYGAPPARFLLLDRYPTVVFGTVISEEPRTAGDFFRSLFLDPEKVGASAQRYLLSCSKLYDQLDPTQRIPAFSLSALLIGTSRHFEKRPDQKTTSITMPDLATGDEEYIIVPDQPFCLKRNQLRDLSLGEEIKALFKERFDERRRWS